jgi:hypothetical protein
VKRPSHHEVYGKLKAASVAAGNGDIKWRSKELGCVMYFKFALKDGAIWITSWHKDRSGPKEGK